MNGMNESVRNPEFFSSFFVTPFLGIIAALLSWWAGARWAAILLPIAAIIHIAGVIFFTQAYNLPLNVGLAETGVPAGLEEAGEVWVAYSEPWQRYNVVRTMLSGVSLILTALGFFVLGRSSRCVNKT